MLKHKYNKLIKKELFLKQFESATGYKRNTVINLIHNEPTDPEIKAVLRERLHNALDLVLDREKRYRNDVEKGLRGV